MDFEFAACTYNVLLRRSQLRAVEMTMQQISKRDTAALEQTTAHDLIAHALASGDCDSVHQVLHKQKLEEGFTRTMDIMQTAQRKGRGSEAQRESTHYKFRATRI